MRPFRWSQLGVLPFVALVATARPLPVWADDPLSTWADDPPMPASSPTPRPSAGTLTVHFGEQTTFIDQAASGPGVTPPEGPPFANGSPAAPLTPYDTFSSAPLTPGFAGAGQLFVTPAYVGKSFDLTATLGAGYVRGSTTNATYWSEPLMPTLSPHLGSQALPYQIVFPTHAGQDDGTTFRASLLSAKLQTSDGNLTLRGGWFNLAQTDRFVFAPPLLPSVSPAIGMQTTESLGSGSPNLDWWTPSPPTLPLYGADLVARHGLATLELTDATLPSLPGTPARLAMGSFAIDHGEGTRWSAQVAHVTTGGDPIPTTVLFGANAALLATPQGNLPVSTVGGQRETIFGVRGAFHATRAFDGIVEYGRSWYDANDVAEPGTAKPGNYYHAGISRHVGRAQASLDWYRNEPYYATILLPYGVPENVWSVAWSWPGQWLKSNYQLLDNTVANVNRQGYRVKYAVSGGPFELSFAYANFSQIQPITTQNAATTGFVDGFFLSQSPAFATIGHQHQYGLWAAWHPAFGDLTFDYIEDTMHRDAAPGEPADAVSYDTPEIVIAVDHRFSPVMLASAGWARYGMRGSFAQGAATNVDYAQRVVFGGVEIRESAHTATLIDVRRSAFSGMPIALGNPSPDFTGTLLIVEQRVRF